MAAVRSTWANRPIEPTGSVASPEWRRAGQMRIPGGVLLAMNDATSLYVALDLYRLPEGARGGDYFWFAIDVGGDGRISPLRDLNYVSSPEGAPPIQVKESGGGAPGRVPLRRLLFTGPYAWAAFEEEPALVAGAGIAPSPRDSRPHRIWEVRIPLSDLGIDLRACLEPRIVRFGLRVASASPPLVLDYPPDFAADFSSLHQIHLAIRPRPAHAGGPDDPLIAGVGLIPLGRIDALGYATTAAGEVPHVLEAPFGGTLDILGGRERLALLWSAGARRYRIMHRAEGGAAFSAMRKAWSNYRWEGQGYELEHVGPDEQDSYPLPRPDAPYAIPGLLLQWSSAGVPPGRHELWIEILDAGGARMPSADGQVLALQIANDRPVVAIDAVEQRGALSPPRGLRRVPGPEDGLRFRITAQDPEGHLLAYALEARWGEGHVEVLHSERAARRWQGVMGELVPRGGWVPPETATYRICLTASSRATDGYGPLPASSEARCQLLLVRSDLG